MCIYIIGVLFILDLCMHDILQSYREIIRLTIRYILINQNIYLPNIKAIEQNN